MYRWVVKWTLSLLNRYRQLKVRYEGRTDVHRVFLELGCAQPQEPVQRLSWRRFFGIE